MKSRLDRYNDNNNVDVPSRLAKNKNLYDELNNKIGFEEITNFNTQTRIELTSLNEVKKSRESYQQLKDYQNLMKKQEEDKQIVEEEEEDKIFDINAILEEARKNRNEIDDLEKKRKLKNEEYNILSDLNKKYLSKDSEDKVEYKDTKDKYEGLEELINTITSKTLVGDIKALEEQEEDKGLLGDLVATSVDLQVNVPSSYENSDSDSLSINKANEESDEEETSEMDKTVDDSFYTRSMDLSKNDFDFSDEGEQGGSAKRIFLIILIIIVLLAIIAVVAYFVLQSMGIKIMKF